MSPLTERYGGLLAGVVLVVLLGGLGTLVVISLAPRTQFGGVWEYRQLFFTGWLWTLGISAGALVCACFLAPLWAMGGMSRLTAVRWTTRGLTEILRGTPFLVLLLVGFYVIADALGITNRVLAGGFLLALYHSCYLGEMLRGGIESVGRLQWESARAVGFYDSQAFRLVILPQALRRVLPGLAGQSITLVKDSALLSVVGVMELTKQAQSASSLTFSTFEAYLPMAAGYLILTLPLSFLSRSLERRLQRAD